MVVQVAVQKRAAVLSTARRPIGMGAVRATARKPHGKVRI
jgi:hypothetical protein